MLYPVKKSIRLNKSVYQVLLDLSEKNINYIPGQYVNVHLDGFDPIPLSIANAPSEPPEMEFHIRYLPNPFSQKLLTEFIAHKHLNVEGPFGECIYQTACDLPIIFMAGGVGFAPIKAIIEYAIANEDTRLMHFYWGARTSEDLYLNQLAEEWAEKTENFKYIPVLSEPEDDVHWPGQTGLVHEVIASNYPDLSGYQIYASGPVEMVMAGKKLFLKQGIQEQFFYSDLK